MLPVHHRYDDFTVVGIIHACLPNSAKVALEAAGRRANEPIDAYAAFCRHLVAIDLEFAAAISGKRKHAVASQIRSVECGLFGVACRHHDLTTSTSFSRRHCAAAPLLYTFF
eukprot:jgi/Tetstr1/426101/TSEL_016431.t1